MKKALILGGSSGIGKATVEKLALSFDEIIIIHRDRKIGTEAVEQWMSELRLQTACSLKNFNIDATDSSKVNETLDQINGTFQLVLHAITRGNLGSLNPTSSKVLKLEDLQLTMDAMCFNVQLWNNLLIRKNLLTKGSKFITLTSEGSSRSWGGYAAVGIAKSALETLTKYLAVEMSALEIRYNCIHAGVTDTPSLRLIPDNDELIAFTENRNPYKRLTKPEDVANAIYLLSLPEANWINGSIIHVDGGEHLV